MALSTKIAHDKSLLNYAKKIDPKNYHDLFNDTWIKFRHKEIESDYFTVKVGKKYQAYFCRMLKNQFLDNKKRENKFIDIDNDCIKHISDRNSIINYSL